MVWKRARRPFAGGAGSRRRAPGFERHDSRPAFPRAAEHGNGRHHAKGRRTDPPQGDFQGVGRSGAQGKGVAGRIRPHWIRPATPFWFPWCAGRGSRGVPPPGVEPGASQRRKQRRYRWGLGRVREGKNLGAPVGRAADHGERSAARARGQVRRITPPSPRCRPGPSPCGGGRRP